MAHKQELVTFTNMCMVREGNRILVQDRTDPGWSGVTFPGGHVEPGESFTDAVIREVREETGLTIEAPRLCGIKDWQSEDGSRYTVLCYQAEHFTGELHASQEGEVFWTTLEELPRLRLVSDMLDALPLFLEEDISEFFYKKTDGRWAFELKSPRGDRPEDGGRS